MTDWKSLARLANPGLGSDATDRIAAGLEALEESFRPLLGQLTHEIEPAVILSEAAVSGQ